MRKTSPPISPQAMAILELLATLTQPVTAKQIAQKLGIKPPAAHHSLSALIEFGLVRRFVIVPNTAKPVFYLCQNYNQTKLHYAKRMEKQIEKDFDKWFGNILKNSYANRIYNS